MNADDVLIEDHDNLRDILGQLKATTPAVSISRATS